MSDGADRKHRSLAKKQERKSELLTTYPDLLDAQPADPDRRERCESSLRLFCEEYLSAWFPLAWSPSHMLAIDRIEAAILRGEQFALAMPRGSGKTTLCRAGVIWAALYAHSPYSVLIHATDPASLSALAAIKSTLRYNEPIGEDWPRIVIPIRETGGEPRKAQNQTLAGEPTGIIWTINRVVMPCVPDEPASEAIIDTSSITGDVRGRNHVLRDGSIVRPTAAIVDDPQSRRSARSEPDCNARLASILGDVGYLAGPDEPNGVVIPCTVIRRGDVADQLLNREDNPEFHGQRIRFFESFPSEDAMKLWQGEYDRLRRVAFADDNEPVKANEFYIANRRAMDDGASIYWPERFWSKKGEVSAIQHGMNLYLRSREAFQAEYQNEPEDAHDLPPVVMLSEAELRQKTSGLKAGIAPKDSSYVVGMIDVHDALLYFALVAVQSDMTGSVIGYSTFPQQPTADFRLTSAKITLQNKHPGSKEAAIAAGLGELFGLLFTRNYYTADGKEIPLRRVLVDTGYMPEPVRAAIQRSEYKDRITGSRGVGLTPDSKPFSEYDFSPQRVAEYGPKDEPRWYVPANKSFTRAAPGVIRFDKYYWLATLHARFATPVGEPSCWDLFGDRYSDHRFVASHLHGQEPAEVHSRGRSIVQWRPVKGKEDHWLDCLVGCLVAASYTGATLPGRMAPEPEPEPISLAAIYEKQTGRPATAKLRRR